jgi:class 3 adenylate cyclase
LGSQTERPSAAHETKVVTIFFSDIVGSTRLLEEHGPMLADKLFQHHWAILLESLATFSSCKPEITGDSSCVVFESPSVGVKFALKLQAELRAACVQEPDLPQCRIGLHQGEVMVKRHSSDLKPEDIFGVQMSITERIMSLGCEGQILCSRSIYDDARAHLRGMEIEGVGELEWRLHGSYPLKGISQPYEIGEVGEKIHAPFTTPTAGGSDEAEKQ